MVVVERIEMRASEKADQLPLVTSYSVNYVMKIRSRETLEQAGVRILECSGHDDLSTQDIINRRQTKWQGLRFRL